MSESVRQPSTERDFIDFVQGRASYEPGDAYVSSGFELSSEGQVLPINRVLFSVKRDEDQGVFHRYVEFLYAVSDTQEISVAALRHTDGVGFVFETGDHRGHEYPVDDGFAQGILNGLQAAAHDGSLRPV